MGKEKVMFLLFTICSALLCQQTIQAKPFISVNFFRLTTRAPISGSSISSSSGSGSNSITSSSASNFQFPDLITPKLRLLTQFLQNGGNVGGGFGFGFKSFGLNRSPTTTTTTNRPEVTTEVQTNYVPDSTESISKTTTKSTSTSTSTTNSSTSTEPTESSESIESTESTESVTGYELPKPTIRSNAAISLQSQTPIKVNDANEYVKNNNNNNSADNNLKNSGTNTVGYNYNPSSENEITSVTKPSHTYLPVATTIDIGNNGINPRN